MRESADSSNLQKRCKYGFTLQFRIFSLYYKPFPVIYFRQYLTKQNDVTISDRQDSYPTPPHPNPLPPRGEGIMIAMLPKKLFYQRSLDRNII